MMLGLRNNYARLLLLTVPYAVIIFVSTPIEYFISVYILETNYMTFSEQHLSLNFIGSYFTVDRSYRCL